jgi:hypothetical protein
MHDKQNWKWIDPDSEMEYDLRHMESFTTPFEVKLYKGDPGSFVNARIIFSNHCYSRTRRDSDADRHVISIEQYEERVFCVDRWRFSQKLPAIIKDLTYKACLQGGSKEILYRQEDRSAPGQHDGWYICMRFAFKSGLEIWVRSAHKRANRPNDIRGRGEKRFCMLLSEYLKGKL